MKVAQSAPAQVPAAPSVHTSRSRSLSPITIDPEWLELLNSAPPSPDAPSFTQTEMAPSTTLNEQAQTVDSLADVLDSLSTNDMIQPPAGAAITGQ